MNKGLKAFENIIESFYDKESKDIQIVKKELKALEIIKEHTLYCEDVDCFVFVNITKEVNDLLKEILL